jgi:hypothetical protein
VFFLANVVHWYVDTRPNKEISEAATVDPAALEMLPRAERIICKRCETGPTPRIPSTGSVSPAYAAASALGRYVRLKLRTLRILKKKMWSVLTLPHSIRYLFLPRLDLLGRP